MAVVIRMKRTGRRNRPCYRITVADSRFPRDGRIIENLGLYDPVCATPENQLNLNVERARHWVGQGAQPSDTVRSILRKNGVYEGLPPKSRHKRTGRGTVTAKRKARTEDKSARGVAKTARHGERVATRRAALAAEKAAKAAEGGEG